MQSSVKNVFIRGSVVRYVHLPAGSVDTQLLEDATRRGKIIAICSFGSEADESCRSCDPASQGQVIREGTSLCCYGDVDKDSIVCSFPHARLDGPRCLACAVKETCVPSGELHGVTSMAKIDNGVPNALCWLSSYLEIMQRKASCAGGPTTMRLHLCLVFHPIVLPCDPPHHDLLSTAAVNHLVSSLPSIDLSSLSSSSWTARYRR